MNKYQNSVSFTGKLNTDDTNLLIPQGDYFASEYFRVMGGVEGETGQGQSITGNSVIENNLLPAGDNVVIGSCPYTEVNSLIYFVWNSNDDHSIFMVNPETSVVTLVAQSSVFNFQQGSPIIHAFVTDNKLYWTDGYFGSYEDLNWNGPRRLDIQWAIDGGIITREVIAWDIYQPWLPPIASYTTDTIAVPTNYLTGKLFQFCYQWVYRTGEESVWSPISKVDLPQGYYVEGFNSNTQIVDNIINVTIQTGSENVRYLRIAYRESNFSEFRMYRELDKQLFSIADNTTYVDKFTKDEFINVLPLALKNNERFPRIAACAELLPTNEAAFANFYEGYDVEKPEYKVEFDYYPYEDYNGLVGEVKGQNLFDEEYGPFASINFYKLWGVNFPWNQGDTIVFSLYPYNLPNTSIQKVTFVVPDYNDPTPQGRWNGFINDLRDFLISLGYVAEAFEFGNAYVVRVKEWFLVEAAGGTEAFLAVYHEAEPRKTFKTGALHQFAIQYYDSAQKDGTVWRSEFSQVKVPSVATISQIFDSNAPFTVKMQVYIGGDSGSYQPPMWATHYQMVYKPPKIEWQQRAIKNIEFTAYGRIKINLEDRYEQQYRGANINYQIQTGDTVRFIRRSNNIQFQLGYLAEYCDNAQEVRVYEYGAASDSSGEYIIIDNIGIENILNPLTGDQPTPSNEFGGYRIASNSIIEIYRNTESLETDPWYEIGECFPVINPHTPIRVHYDQVLNDEPQRFVLSGGNAYIRKRPQGAYYIFPWSQMTYIEDPDFSDYFPSRVYDYGRLAIEDVNAKERKFIAAVGHTSQYLDNTRINRLNQVDFQNVKYLREENGPINRIIMNGFTLSCLQDRKNTSIYTQRTMAVNGEGTSNLVLTDRTFSEPRALEQNWGAVHGGSVIVAYGNLYYYDYLNNIFVASTGGGQINLSLTAKFAKGSRELTENFAQWDNKRIFACQKQQFNEVYWAFCNGAGVAFNPEVGFCYRTSHEEESVGSIGRYSFSFLEGNIYVDNEGTELNFNGQQKECLVGWTFNVGPNVTKEFLNLWIQSDKRWDVVDIKVNGNINYPDMQSFLPADLFNAQEGYLVAPYRRDINDPRFTDQGVAYVNGRALRGYAANHIMTYSGEEKALLFNAAVLFMVSNPINS
jgi:hypothetical protein